MTRVKDPNRLEVYSETRRSRIFVGLLSFDSNTEIYTFEYDRSYLKHKAVPIGPDVPLRKRTHQSKKNKIFASFDDRIPSRENPAFGEYCESVGIDPNEQSKVVLLGTIGKRGPSTFIFEPLYLEEPIDVMLVNFRKQLDLTLREFSLIFDLNYPTVSKIETRKSHDRNTANLVRIYMTIPQAALWRVELNSRKVHSQLAQRLIEFFRARMKRH